jgi:hypothetical protein
MTYNIKWTNLLEPAKKLTGFVYQKLILGIENWKGLVVDLFASSK